MSGKIRLDAASLENAAANARTLGNLLEECGRAAKAIPLAGLEPKTRGRTEAAASRASAMALRAGSAAEAQAPVLKRRAALARKADAGGGFLRGLGGMVDSIESAVSKLETMRSKVRSQIVKRANDDMLARRKRLKHAKRLWNDPKEKWRQKLWSSPEEMNRELKERTPTEIKALEKKTRILEYDKKLRRRIPPGVRNSPLLRGPMFNNPVTRRVPVVGIGIGTAADIAGGDSVPDAAGKNAASAAGSAAGAAVGGAACTAAAGVSFGAGAVSCPFLIGGGAVLGGMGGEALYEGAKGLVNKLRGKKPVVKLIPAPKKITIAAPKLKTSNAAAKPKPKADPAL